LSGMCAPTGHNFGGCPLPARVPVFFQQGQSRRCRRRGGKPDMPDKGVKSKGASQFRPIHRPAKDRLVRRVNDRIADTRQQRQPDDLLIGGGEAHRRDRQGH